MNTIEVMRSNLLSIQVCAAIPPERIQEVLLKTNIQHPAGTMNGWGISDAPESAPCKCGDCVGRWHYVFIC